MHKLLLKAIIILVTYLVIPMAHAETMSPEVRKITPPRLDNAHLGERIIAYRPMRHGSPELSVEKRGDKIIANDYGHGGSGWSLAPGSVAYVNQLLLASPYAKDLKKDTPITVIGAGVIGLFTAYDLIQRGYTNITVVAEKFDNLTSHNAGGLLAPASMDNDPKMQKIIDDIAIEGYKFFEKIANKTHPDFKNGAAIMPLYTANREDSGVEAFVGKVMQPAKDVMLDFGNGTTRKMVAYDDSMFMDTAVMMQALHDYLKPRVKFVQKKINSFNEIDTQYIFNCAGLGGGALNDDNAVVPVQGHLVLLKDQNPEDVKHSILVYSDKKDKTKTGQTVKRSYYLIPKHMPGTGPNDIGVIGGTYIEGATEATPNKEQFEIMIKDAKKFYGL